MSDENGLSAAIHDLAAEVSDLRAKLAAQEPVVNLGRTEFERMPAAEQMAFVKRGGRVHNSAPAPKPTPQPGSVSRAEFDSWGADKRHGHIKAGRAVHDI